MREEEDMKGRQEAIVWHSFARRDGGRAIWGAVGIYVGEDACLRRIICKGSFRMSGRLYQC
jgi:hypothetical protein